MLAYFWHIFKWFKGNKKENIEIIQTRIEMNILKIVIINSYLLENRGDSLNVETKNMLNICEVYAYEYRKKKKNF